MSTLFGCHIDSNDSSTKEQRKINTMSSNTPTTLASRLKEVYPEGPSVLVPNANELHGKRLKFRKDIAQGEKIRFDVQLSGEQGFSMGSGSVTLNGAVAQTSEKAEVSGYTIVLQSNVSYDAISRAKSSKQSFAQFNSSKYIPAAESFRTRCEILAMHGRRGIATVSSVSSQVITITAASWCSALLLTLKGATVEAWTAVAGSGSQHDGDLTVGAISIANKTITVVGTCSSVAAGDILFLKNQRSAGPIGLMDIAYNAGTLYNISAATYELWKANVYDVGTSALSLGKLSAASALSADKGCVGEKLTVLVPNKAFQSIVNDQAALRMYGADYSKNAENGFESIKFHGAAGVLEVVPYAFCKEGEFVMFPERFTYLLGSEEMDNQMSGTTQDVWFDLESTSDKQMRFFGDWTVFCEKPGFITYGYRSDGLALHT
jgi:hypothetical protein